MLRYSPASGCPYLTYAFSPFAFKLCVVRQRGVHTRVSQIWQFRRVSRWLCSSAGVQDSLIRKNWQATVILPLIILVRYVGSASIPTKLLFLICSILLIIASCNFLEIGLFNSSNSFRMNEKIPSVDSNVDVRLASFLPQIWQALMMKQGKNCNNFLLFEMKCSQFLIAVNDSFRYLWFYF